MTRRRSAVWAFVVLALNCAAVELRELPEVLATLNGVPIRRAELSSALAPRLEALGGNAAPEELRRVVRGAVDDEICGRLLSAMLSEAGLAPSRELALEYLAGVLRELPAPRRRELERELLPQADEPGFQLKAAVHLYLLRHCDRALLTVTDAEVGRYYQMNILRYRLPERWDVGVIRIDRRKAAAVELAESARARLLQGESFARVAGEVDPEGGGEKLSPEELRRLFADELSRLSAGDVSRVISAPDACFVLLLRKKEPGGVVPLEEAAGYIRLELSAAKDTLALRQVLAKRVAESRIVYSALER